MTITKADFVELLPFSNQIEVSQLGAFITQAHQLDLLPLLGHETIEALDALVLPTILPADAALSLVVTGQCYVRRERVYRALSATVDPIPVLNPSTYTVTGYLGNIANPAPEGQWQYERILTLWSQYVRAYWVQRALSRFVATHGVNITKAGLTVAIDRNQGTYDRPSAGQVATLQASIDNTAEALLSRLTRFLRLEGLLWFIDPLTGFGAYSLNGLCAYEPGGPTADTPGLRFSHNTHRHGRTIRGINR